MFVIDKDTFEQHTADMIEYNPESFGINEERDRLFTIILSIDSDVEDAEDDNSESNT